LLGAFSSMMNRKLNVSQAVTIASNIEAKVLNTPTGTQDYYPPLLGGVNVLNYSHEGCRPEKFVNKECMKELEKNFLLVYTGIPHHSGLNNWEVLKNSIEKKGDTIKSLAKLKNTADDMKTVLNSGNWKALRSLFNHEYEARVQLSPVFSSPEIERLRKVALSSGAEAVKICGAGGGGCVMVWCPPDSKKGVVESCQSAGFQVLPARPVEAGLEVVVSV
ncbi:MAG: galactokinase, partial [Bdellovibrionia bacterium]